MGAQPIKSSRSVPALSSRKQSAAEPTSHVTGSQSARTSSSSGARRQSTRKYSNDLSPIFGEKTSSEETVGESLSMHQLGEYKPKRYLAKAKPKTRKCE